MIIELTAVEALRVAYMLQSFAETTHSADLKKTAGTISHRLEVELDQMLQDYNEAVRSYQASHPDSNVVPGPSPQVSEAMQAKWDKEDLIRSAKNTY